MLRHKYNAKRSEHDGQKFDSKLEGKYYLYLKQLRAAGHVLFFLRQVPFHLPGNTTYRVDFQVFWSTGDITFDDVKGMATADFIMRKKQVEDLYAPAEIRVVKKGDF